MLDVLMRVSLVSFLADFLSLPGYGVFPAGSVDKINDW
jgi:hypothetical protein